MPRTCSICAHPEREAIDTALVAGASLRDIAGRFAVSRSALSRHKRDHIPAHLARAKDAAEAAQADDLLGEMRKLQRVTLGILGMAAQAGDLPTALRAIAEARRNLELLAKLLGELDERPQVNVLVMPEWHAVRAAMVAALRPYPDARQAVASALSRIEAGDGR